MQTTGMKSRLAALYAALFVFVARAAEPWALWTHFTGADATTGLAPQFASTQNGIDASAWRFKLNGNASAIGGMVFTGTGAAPAIEFGSAIDVGRASDGGKPMTVLLALWAPVGNAVGKPLVHLGNGSTGVGMALASLDAAAGTARVRGTWGNQAWGVPRVAVDALAKNGGGVDVCGAFHVPES